MIGGATLAGSIEGGFMNEEGDWAVTWDVDVGPANLEALIINGELILTEGEPVDWNGDGVIDGGDGGAVLDNFTGISSLTLSDRQADGTISAYFTADVDIAGTVLTGAFRVTVPEPGSASLLLFAIIPLALARRQQR